MFRNPAADEVLIHKVWLVSCPIVSERGVIRGVGLGRLENKNLLCAHCIAVERVFSVMWGIKSVIGGVVKR